MSHCGSTIAATPALASPTRYEAHPRSSWMIWRKSISPDAYPWGFRLVYQFDRQYGMKNPMTDSMLERAGLGLTARKDVERHRVVALVGNPRAHSRTASLASAVAVRLCPRVSSRGSRPDRQLLWRLIDMATGNDGRQGRPGDDLLAAFAGAVVVVVASPVRRGSYTGLTKLFLLTRSTSAGWRARWRSR